MLIIHRYLPILFLVLGYTSFYYLDKIYSINPLKQLSKVQQFIIVLSLLFLNRYIIGGYKAINISPNQNEIMRLLYATMYGFIFALIPTKQKSNT